MEYLLVLGESARVGAQVGDHARRLRADLHEPALAVQDLPAQARHGPLAVVEVRHLLLHVAHDQHLPPGIFIVCSYFLTNLRAFW